MPYEALRPYNRASLYVNRDDFYKQQIKDGVENFSSRVSSILKDAPNLIFIAFPMSIMSLFLSVISYTYKYMLSYIKKEKQLHYCNVEITPIENKELNLLSDLQFDPDKKTNIKECHLERTELRLEHDPYKDKRHLLDYYSFRKKLYLTNNIIYFTCNYDSVDMARKELINGRCIYVNFDEGCFNWLVLVIAPEFCSENSGYKVTLDDLIYLQHKLQLLFQEDDLKIACKDLESVIDLKLKTKENY